MQSYELARRVMADDLKPLGTDWRKPFLETAPHHRFNEYMNLALTAKRKQLLRSRKCGIAAGFCWQYIKWFGFFNPYPSPMNFLTKTLSRPENETVSTNSRRLSG
jgi:hypothetical protein